MLLAFRQKITSISPYDDKTVALIFFVWMPKAANEGIATTLFTFQLKIMLMIQSESLAEYFTYPEGLTLRSCDIQSVESMVSWSFEEGMT